MLNGLKPCSLPVRNGGLGVRRASLLAPSAFLASAVGTRDLQEMILFKCDATVDSAIISLIHDLVMDQWAIAHGQSGVSHRLLVNSRTNQIADDQFADWSTRGYLLNKHGVRELTRYPLIQSARLQPSSTNGTSPPQLRI